MTTLTFCATDFPLMTFDINTESRTATLTYDCKNKLATDPILKDDEKNYTGIQKRLSDLTTDANRDKTLEEYLEMIKHGDYQADAQHTLTFRLN